MAGVAGRAVRQIVSTGRAERSVVTLCALQRGVRAGQREAGGRVIESGTGPARGVVTLGAILRESRLDVIRSRRASEVFLMAGVAGRGVRQIVRTGRAERSVVTLCALQRGVRAGQREAGGRVIESGTGPARGVVTLGAILREARLDVIRSRRASEVFLMAGVAGRAVRQIVSTGRAERSVGALGALQRGVPAGQREGGVRVC